MRSSKLDLLGSTFGLHGRSVSAYIAPSIVTIFLYVAKSGCSLGI